jgi:hypothetical protein
LFACSLYKFHKGVILGSYSLLAGADHE